MTEGLGISWLVLQTYVYLLALRNPTTAKCTMSWCVSVIGFMIRPAFLIIPIVCLLLIGVFHNRLHIWRKVLITLLLFIIVPIIFTSINRSRYGYSGISYFSDINLLGIIMQNDIPIDAGTSQKNIYNSIVSYRASGGDPYVYRFIRFYDPTIFSDIAKLKELQSFVRIILKKHTGHYVWSTLLAIPKIFLYHVPLDPTPDGHPAAVALFRLLDWMFDRIKYITIAILPILLLHGYMLFHKKTYEQLVLFMIGTIALTQVITTAFFVYESDPVYKRMMVPVLYHAVTYVFVCIFVYLQNRLTTATDPS